MEKQVLIKMLKLVKSNPQISNLELSQKLNVILEDVEKGLLELKESGDIIGRSFIFPKKTQVLCIGGANIDRKIQVLEGLEYGTSNPSNSTISCGGVARNIAENLGRINCQTSLLSFVGGDHEGEWLLNQTKRFVDITPTEVIPQMSTGTYTAVLNEEGEMIVALADMVLYDSIQRSLIEKKWGIIRESEMVLLDTNLPSDILSYIIKRCQKENIPLSIVPVSAPKVKKLPHQLDGVTWLIANQSEAEALADFPIQSDGDYFRAAELILKKGVERVVITRGDKGLIYFTKNGEASVILPPEIQVDDVTGAGDSLVAGILYGYLKGVNTEDACKIGMSCSIITLQSYETVNPELSKQKLQETYQKYFN
ncbi:carbohydrate kinase family protein [Neobacillus sp. D3-1R]|uniref:carbohydrate kinase family protein n=1 Tax=Neobacillus sp. D3-1R TaxID=3445778 RepID=UPI003F9FDDC4